METLKEIKASDGLKEVATSILGLEVGQPASRKRKKIFVRTYYKGDGRFVAYATRKGKVLASAEAEGFFGGTDARRTVEEKIRKQDISS